MVDKEAQALPEFEGSAPEPASGMVSAKNTGGQRRKLLLISGGVLLLMCVCVGLLAILSGGGDDRDATSVAQFVQETSVVEAEADVAEVEPTAEATEMPAPTHTPRPTETPEPTNTPRPTETPLPTATPDPNLVRPGTYLVGSDIEPGLYRGKAGLGVFSSCYWARLSGVSGSFDDLLANDNSVGQYYIEVLASDVALETACELGYLPEMPAPAEPFPTQIGPGMYIVGIDIQPGRYRGVAGEDVMESCYWARLSGFTGSFGALLTNNNATGQFFIQVAPGDVGLQTACELELVE